MLFAFTLDIDENVIKVHYHKNVEFLYQNLVDIAFEHSQCVGQFKKHHLVLKIAIAGPKDRFPFVSFPNLYSIISIDQIKLGETLSPT